MNAQINITTKYTKTFGIKASIVHYHYVLQNRNTLIQVISTVKSTDTYRAVETLRVVVIGKGFNPLVTRFNREITGRAHSLVELSPIWNHTISITSETICNRVTV